MFSSLATHCGYTPAEIREMTLDDVQRIQKGWRQSPPVGLLLALVHKYQPPDDKPPEEKYMTAADMRRLMATTKGKLPGIGRA